MKKLLKTLCILSLVLVVLGSAVFGVGLLIAKGDFSALSYLTAQQKDYTEQETVTSIFIDAKTADVDVVLADVDKVNLSYSHLLTKKNKPANEIFLSENNGTLSFRERTIWYRTLSTYTPDRQIVLTLPADRTYSLSVSVSTGNVRFNGNQGLFSSLTLETITGDINAQSTLLLCEQTIKAETSTGHIKLGEFQTKNLFLEVNTGDILLSGNGVATEKISLEANTGDVKSAQSVLNSPKILIETDTGDVKIKLAGKQTDYSVYIDTDTGDTNIHSYPGGAKTLSIETDTGDINVTFEE